MLAIVLAAAPLTGCGGALPFTEEPETIESKCAEVTERFSTDLRYDEDAPEPMSVLPERLEVLEQLRADAEELETAGGEPAPERWLEYLDTLINQLDGIINWEGGPGTDVIFVMNVNLHESQVRDLGNVAMYDGMGEECSEIDDWKFFPETSEPE